MAVHFHPLVIKSIRKETPECVTLCFDVPQALEPVFQFKEGQNLTLKKNINGEEIRRSYSICAAPHENELRVAIKKVPGGSFSGFANEELKAGDTIEVLPPSGKFTSKISSEPDAKYLAVAAGSGITPIIAIIKHTLQTQPQSSFTLLYGNQNRQSIIFFEELEALKNKFIGRFQFINVLSRERLDAELLYGRIDDEKLKSFEKIIDYAKMNAVYLCGPEAMIFTVRNFLESKGLDQSKIHFELFHVPGQASSVSGKKETSISDDQPRSKIELTLDGRTIHFELAAKGLSILDAALQQGADLPYACKGGVCCSCRAKVTNGSVQMDVNYALEPEEVEAGYILTCQSHPTSENVVVNFDLK